MKHGEKKTFDLSLHEGNHTISFEEIKGKGKGSISLTVKNDMEVSYKIKTHSDIVDVEEIDVFNKVTIAEDEIMLEETEYDYSGKNYKDVMQELEKIGFTNFVEDPLYDIFWGYTLEGSIETVLIDGREDFKRGDIFKKDVVVYISYHMPEDEAPTSKAETTISEETISEQTEEIETDIIETTIAIQETTTVEETTIVQETTTVEETTTVQETTIVPETIATLTNGINYTTNDKTTYKNGNSGKYSYVKTGKNYDIYCIIDFDEGCVYFFYEGNGITTCDRVKIVEGDLNTFILLQYHDGDDTWNEAVNFKYHNQPDHLIWQDADKQSYDFYTTDLDKAISLRDKKIIHDY